jgi:hypothetical protein
MTTDPDFLTPDQRFADVARLLAAGVRRLFAAWLRADLGPRLSPERSGKTVGNRRRSSPPGTGAHTQTA